MLLDMYLPLWGARGSVFESHRPDQLNQRVMNEQASSKLAFLFFGDTWQLFDFTGRGL